ncbi:MAG: protein-L-isoaspartate O-methyltransferase [Lysobacterales bacterium]|jgi:protein-L-isoaspartate(D-aspartate) O-methyltransferase|nr:MAG: protein-L-isoaspartate O-methyltransferase [Xanthomonadales bacterium]
MLDLEAARRQMIEQQVRAWDVLDLRILDAMKRTPREAYVPAACRELAFADMNVPISHGQAMLSPSLEGRILQSLELKPEDTVFEVGTGTGYFAACLGALTRAVRSVEIFPDLADGAREALRRGGVHNVSVAAADVYALPAGPERYDVVVLTGSLPVYDTRFERMLQPGGRLFAIVGSGPAMEARRVVCSAPGQCVRESLFETFVDPLIHAAEPPKFVF